MLFQLARNHVLNTRPSVLAICTLPTCRRGISSSHANRNDVLVEHQPVKESAIVYVDSVFPICRGSWDPRYYLATFRRQEILDELHGILERASTQGFRLVRLNPPQLKDGGVFAHFEYTTPTLPKEIMNTPKEGLIAYLHKTARVMGGIPSWVGLRHGNIWLVQGEPWEEDLHRYPASVVKVEFEGPDIHPETLYHTFRPYGRIVDITRPAPVPAGTLRSSDIHYSSLRSAVRARNCLHGVSIPLKNSTVATRLSIIYERVIKAHVIRDWLSKHPRIALPIALFLLATMTYTIFDPVRILMIKARVQNWFAYRDYAFFQWLRRNTIGFLDVDAVTGSPSLTQGGWKERKDAEATLSSYLSEYPSTVAFLHGPAGSGKSNLISHTLGSQQRPALIIDCAPIFGASSDAQIISNLAKQTGYWPIFGFLSSMNNVIDLASLGLVGQKVGFSTSLENQLKDMLETVATALQHINLAHSKSVQHSLIRAEREQARIAAKGVRRDRLRKGLYHDGRLDCVSGNGIMSELGFGDELLDEQDVVTVVSPSSLDHPNGSTLATDTPSEAESRMIKTKQPAEVDISGLPIVVIKNYGVKGSSKHDEVLEVLSQFSASLIEKQIAHVIVVSDNRENMKRLARSQGSRPLTTISLNDADNISALSIVKAKLDNMQLTPDQVKCVERLGGRSRDLDTLIYKIKNGRSVEDAVEDIIVRAMGKLRKNAFGDDMEDTRSLPWKSEQAWTIISKLSATEEIPYAGTLVEFPFKGDDVPLREMERADLISIVTNDGLPVSIKPGRPVYRFVFERLMNDPIFYALQQINYNEKAISSAESMVRSCEEELMMLKTIGFDNWRLTGSTSGPAVRSQYLLAKMGNVARKIQELEAVNARLRKKLAAAPESQPRSKFMLFA